MIVRKPKTVFIIGNGFDLDLGLKTSYKDFYESSYCPYYYPAPLIYHLNLWKSEELEVVRWYDLENELLNYYNGISNPDNPADHLTDEDKQFIISYRPESYFFGLYDGKVLNKLADKGVLFVGKNPNRAPTIPFRDEINITPLKRDRKALNLIKEGLCKYLQNLKRPDNEKDTIAYNVLSTLYTEAMNKKPISVYSFNYTPVLLNGSPLDAMPVHYMHGSCEGNRIIIGTRDDRTIKPTYSFLQKSFDSSYNSSDLVEDLRTADEVIVFGHSLGENDWQYFKPFFSKQADYSNAKRKSITIFTRDNESEEQIKDCLNRMTDGGLSMIFNLNNFQIIKTGNLKEDMQKLRDFLVKHGKQVDQAQKIIDNALNPKV